MNNSFSLKLQPNDLKLKVIYWVKNRRKQLKWSQAELAERSGVSFGSIKRFETTGKIAFESLLKILHVLDYLEELNEVFNSDESAAEVERLFTSQNQNAK